VEGFVDSKQIKNESFLILFFWISEPVTEPFGLRTGPVPECFCLVHGKELPIPKGWNSLLPLWEPQVSL
jgi:hypothetical protein